MDLLSVWAITASIIIGITSNLLTPYVAKFLGNLSDSFKKRNEARKLIFDKTVAYILENPQEEIHLRIRFWGRSVGSMIVMMVSVVLMYSSNPIGVAIGFIFFLVGNWGNTKANKLGKILDKVGEHKKAKRPDIDLD